jgi:hypothetical protein
VSPGKSKARGTKALGYRAHEFQTRRALSARQVRYTATPFSSREERSPGGRVADGLGGSDSSENGAG